MKKWFIIICGLIPNISIAQIDIPWTECVQEKVYNYTNEKLEDYILKKKLIKFCYNKQYFGFNDNGYMQIFPLESFERKFNKDGYLTESFVNGKSQNYNFGDLFILVTYSDPASILINYTVLNPWSIYIQTKSLKVMKNK